MLSTRKTKNLYKIYTLRSQYETCYQKQLNAALLEHQALQEADARERQHRRQNFLGSDLDTAD